MASQPWLFQFPTPPAGAGSAGAVRAGEDSDYANGNQYLDIGLYGVPHSAAYAKDHVYCQRAMEEIVRREGGFMFNYSVGYSTRDEFWRTFDRALYDAIRNRTGAVGSFVDIYTKLGGGDKIDRWLAARHKERAAAIAAGNAPYIDPTSVQAAAMFGHAEPAPAPAAAASGGVFASPSSAGSGGAAASRRVIPWQSPTY